jgi:hypothetical protein
MLAMVFHKKKREGKRGIPNLGSTPKKRKNDYLLSSLPPGASVQPLPLF